jgi:5-formyltetrahydrofolate cyclo-ligase
LSAVIAKTKSIIRKEILNLLRNQKEEDRIRKGLVILARLFALPEFQKAKTILFYASFDGEVDTFEMMKRSLQLRKKIALPTINLDEKKIIPMLVYNLEEDLIPGPYGIKQPRFAENRMLDLSDIDLSVVPGLAFDKNRHRLGRGAGYYDRFLARLPQDVPCVGLAYDFQFVERLPKEAHDIPLSRIISS